MLNKSEQKVLEIIEQNPFITQKEIAAELNMTRSTVATIISTLTQKKQLLGRAYVVNHSSSVYCIGAMNVDRKYHLLDEMVAQTSNPATSDVSVGGVVRNVAENLGRVQQDVSLISLGGYDQDFYFIKNETEAFVNMQHVTQKNGMATGAYNAILDLQGEMQFAVADMQIYDEMNVEWIASYQNILSKARLIIIDLNLPFETVDYLLTLARQYQVEIFIIPVSGPKMKHLPQDLQGVSWIIVNQDESEAFFDIEVNNNKDFEDLIDCWLEVGVQNVIVTRGNKGSIYGNQIGERHTFTPPQVEKVIDVTGAGDAYAAGVIYGHLNDYAPTESIHIGMANAFYTIQSPDTVQTNLTETKLIEQVNTLFKKEKI